MSIVRQDYGSIYDPHAESLIAPIQETLVAYKDYAVGQCFILDGVMYRMTQAVLQGATIVIGTDCEVAPPVTDMMMGDTVIGTPEPIGTITVGGTTYTKYRAIIDFGALPNNGADSKNHGITFNKILNVYGVATNNTYYIHLPHTNPETLNDSIGLWVTNQYIQIRTGSDRSAYTALITIEYY